MSGWDGKLGTVNIKLDLPAQAADGGSSANGTWTFQNSTPSDARFQNSEPGFGDVAAFSARTYANFAGSIGKQSEIQAAADFARPYQCDLDNSRPGVLAPRLQWQRALNVTFDDSTTGKVVSSAIRAPVDTAMYGLGGIVTAGGTEDWLYSFDPTVRRYVPRVQLNLPGGLAESCVPTPLRYQIRVTVGAPTIRETSGHIWIPVKNGGAIDAALPFASQVVTPTATPPPPRPAFWHFVSFGGYIVSFEQSDPTGAKAGMTISLRKTDASLDVHTPASLSGIDAAPELGNALIQEVVPDWLMCHAPVVYGGAIYCCSDRQVLKVVFDDENCRLLSVPIHSDFTRITGNPAVFQGSLFVPSGNTLWKWTPGQLEFTPVPIDTFGDLPANRGGGVAVALLPVAGGLLVTTMSNPAAATDSSLLMMDAQNVFQMLDYSPTAGAAGGQNNLRLCHFLDLGYDAFGDASGGPVVGIVCTDTAASKRVIGRRESNRDPVYLPVQSRKQVPGSHFWISPIDPGIGYGDLKQALKLAMACADVSAVRMIRIYYQTDYEGLLANTVDAGYAGPITGTMLESMGTFHLAATLDNDASGALGLAATPNGGHAGFCQVSLVARKLVYRSIRWVVEIVSDDTGVLYPRLIGLKFYYSETPIVYVVHSLRIRILAGDPDLASVALGAPKTPDDVYNTYNTLWGYAKDGSFQTWLDPNGDSRTVKITKFVYNAVDLMDTPDGLPAALRRRVNKMVLQLALQEADS